MPTASPAALFAVLLTVTGCTTTTHTVVEKEHLPARAEWRTEHQTRQKCTTTTRRSTTGTRSDRSCRPVPDGTRQVRYQRPECWELELDSGQEVCVARDVWRRTKVGDRL
jgi:hypothetical protein